MKNIHILPTDKPSRIYKVNHNNKSHWTKDYLEQVIGSVNQNIYITSDEEIKEGDWYINNGHLLKCTEVKKRSSCRKIILTTDQDLIKDGVQVIPDEFLEWFIKNPSCEFVEIVEELKYFNLDELRERHLKGLPHIYSEKIGYKIIIPKEEYKQREIFLMNANTVIDTRKPKQETLEEAIKQQFKYDNLQYAKEISSRIKVDSYPDIDNKETLENFIKSIYPSPSGGKIRGIELGAKWQAERMYSEEDMKQFGLYLGDNFKKLKGKTIDEIFEQFKKK